MSYNMWTIRVDYFIVLRYFICIEGILRYFICIEGIPFPVNCIFFVLIFREQDL